MANRECAECGYVMDVDPEYPLSPRTLELCDECRELDELRAEVERLRAALHDIADRWADDDAHAQSHPDDCGVVICVAKRALRESKP